MDNKWRWLEDLVRSIKQVFIPEYGINVMESKEVDNPKGWIQYYTLSKNNKKFLEFFVQHTQPDDGNTYQQVGGIIACGIINKKKV